MAKKRPATAKTRTADRALATRKLLAAARGARLCYGEPIYADGRTVITVARVSAAAELAQRGSGGRVDAVPVGFIEISQAGARFEPIDGGAAPGARPLAAAGAAATALLAAAIVKRPRRTLSRSPRQRLLPR